MSNDDVTPQKNNRHTQKEATKRDVNMSSRRTTYIDGDQFNLGRGHAIFNYYLPSDADPQSEESERQFCQALISRVSEMYIECVFNQSLIHGVYMELDYDLCRDVVPQPKGSLAQDREPITDQTIIDVFDQYQGQLLLLGSAGSGKTTTLLRLAKELLARATENSASPIPIVLDLSSWVPEQADFLIWLTHEICRQYNNVSTLALNEYYIKKGKRIVFLLDGLDEIQTNQNRSLCVESINQFQETYAAQMVVCCRANAYEELPHLIRLGIGITLKQLTAQQIEKYLETLPMVAKNVKGINEHEGTAEIQCAIRQYKVINELAQSPLMLSLMPIAYAGLTHDQIGRGEDFEKSQEDLIEQFVTNVFKRIPEMSQVYEKEEALHWFSFIAQGLNAHGREQTFYIESLQPTWCPDQKTYRNYHITITVLLCFCLALFSGFIGGAIGWLQGAWLQGLLVMGCIGLSLGLLRQLMAETEIKATKQQVLQWDLHAWIKPLKMVLRDGLIWYLLIVLGLSRDKIDLQIDRYFPMGAWVERVYGWIEYIAAWSDYIFIDNILIMGGCFAFAFALLNQTQKGALSSLFKEVAYTSKTYPPPDKVLIQATKEQLVQGIIIFLVCGFLVSFVCSLIFEWYAGVAVGGLVGLSLGVMVAWSTTIENTIKHYTLRFFLAQLGHLPYAFSTQELVNYLDWMEDRWLWHRVGRGWRFHHKVILEYFANRSQVKIDPDRLRGGWLKHLFTPKKKHA